MKRALVFGALLGLLFTGGSCKRKMGGSFSKKSTKKSAPVDAATRPRPAGPVQRVLLFTAKWCPTCHQLKKKVLSAPVGKALLAGAVLQTVDFDKMPARVAQHSVTGLPTTVFVGAQGQERGRIEGFESTREYVAEARAIMRGRDLLPVLLDELIREPKNLNLRYRVGRKLLGLGKEKEAFDHYDKVLAQDPTDKSGAVAKILMHRSRYLVRVKRDYPAAVVYLRAAVKRIPSGRAGESLRYWLAHALCLSGKPAEAARIMDAYVKQRGGKANALLLAAGLRRKCAGGYELPRALAQARAAVQKKPKNDWGWYLVAALSHQLKKPAAAKQAIERAIALEPDSAFYVNEYRRMVGAKASRRR